MGVNTNTGSGDSTTSNSSTDVIITGTTGDDVLTIDANTTSVWAGTGTDTVVFSGDFADYTYGQSDSFVPFIKHTSTDKTVSLYDVEVLEFNGVLYDLSNNGNGEFRINTTTSSYQINPDIAVLSNGGFVVTWNGYIVTTEESGFDVAAQIYDGNGNVTLGEFKVNSYSNNGGQINPSVVVLDDDSFITTWQSSYKGIIAKRYDIDGQAVFGTEFKVSYLTNSDFPDIIKLSGGGFIVAYAYHAPYGDDSIRFQRYDENGDAVGGEVVVDLFNNSENYKINIVTLENQNFVISWMDGATVKAKIYDTSGNVISDTFSIDYTGVYQSYDSQNQSIAATLDGGFIAVWNSLDENDRGIFAQRYNETGSATGEVFQVNTYTISRQEQPSVISIKNGGFVVAWQSNSQNGGDYDILAQRYDASGNVVGGEFQVNTYDTGAQTNLKISETLDGGFIIAWQSEHQDGSSYGIYAQRYDSNGNRFGEVSIATLSELTGTANDDSLQGDDGVDHISTLAGADVVYAEMGSDIITLTADGVWSNDYVAENMSYSVWVGTGEKVILTGYNQFNDVIYGGGDVDTIILTDGSDAFFLDNIYTAHHSSLTLLSTVRGTDSTARVEDVEVIYAGAGNDIIDLTSDNFNLIDAISVNGEEGDDILWGSTGVDTINGGAGNDVINGGVGSDILTGGSGADEFQFTASSAADIITDFNITEDSIKLYYRAEDKHTYDDISILNGVLSWGASDYFVTPISIDLSSRIVSSDLSNIPDLSITFVEIV